MQFEVVVPHWICIAPAPNIFHLVELKDTYHRYVVLLCANDSARILEVNLGAVTTELLLQRPDLRQRAVREWGKDFYQSSHEDVTHFVGQQIS